MFPEDFARIDTLVRTLSSARWTRFAMMRSSTRAPWLDDEIERLYDATATGSLTAFSDEDVAQWLANLLALEAMVIRVETAIPFERKLRPIMRPFRQRFQSIIRLRNAMRCGIAAIQLRLGRTENSSMKGIRLSVSEMMDVRDRITSRAPGWTREEMRVYDCL